MATAAETLSFPTGALREKKKINKNSNRRTGVCWIHTDSNLPSRVATQQEPKSCQQQTEEFPVTETIITWITSALVQSH